MRVVSKCGDCVGGGGGWVVGGLPWVFDVVGVGLPALASWLMTEKGGRGRRQGRPVERAVLSVLLVA